VQEGQDGQQEFDAVAPAAGPPYPPEALLDQERRLLGQGRNPRRSVRRSLSCRSSHSNADVSSRPAEFPIKYLDLTQYMPPPLSATKDPVAEARYREDPRTQTPPYVYELCGWRACLLPGSIPQSADAPSRLFILIRRRLKPRRESDDWPLCVSCRPHRRPPTPS
jgi:hypothetical protein